MPPGHYVEEFYANPAFMELPFDGSNTNPSDLPYVSHLVRFCLKYK